MLDVSSSEIPLLFATNLYCRDAPEWLPHPQQPGSFEIHAGLLDSDGVRSNLQVHLVYRHTAKLGKKRYVFSVFKANPWGLERVYQLDVLQQKVAIKDEHAKPHEHLGTLRVKGQQTWATWKFEDVLQHFCDKTKITFSPALEPPENFVLKG